jgi:hypothetical protein
LDAPSARPDEHVMAGVAAGPGPGPIEAGLVPAGGGGNLIVDQLRAYYAAHPNDDLAKLLEAIDAGDYAAGGRLGKSVA